MPRMGAAPYYHVGFVVQDIEQATADLSRAIGLTWGEILDFTMHEWDLRLVVSREGPPFIEVLQAPDGSPWDASAGPRIDHLGVWTEDLERDRRRLVDAGAPLDVDGPALGRPFTYHRVESAGARIELVDLVRRPEFVERWAPGDPPMDVLDLDG
jgi:hypothetical protein